MNTHEFDSQLEHLARHNGLECALELCQEECAELVQAISKWRRANRKGDLRDKHNAKIDVQEELADVLVTVTQLIYLLDNSTAVRRNMEEKLRRTFEREGLKLDDTR